MDWMTQVVGLFLHLDDHLVELFSKYGVWTYGILFLIVFLETGIVVTPFLPGDSLLFAAGALSASGGLNPVLLFVLLAIAAILGDTVNYAIGRATGPRVFREDVRWLKREYLERTHRFYEKHGGKTIILARFVPIIRTFAPFVAGVGTMSYPRFVIYNIAGGILWTALFTFAGYFFGNLPAVKENFSFVILGIIFVSLVPFAIEAAKRWGPLARRAS
ncbi:MAG TPA: DedA family protein [bacterium]|nr:DedA family protein [bacterium]